MDDDKRINTGGGAVTHGDVHTQGDFVGRDVHNIHAGGDIVKGDVISSRSTSISGNTLIALVALLIVGVIAILLILRPGLSWVEGLMPAALPPTTVLSPGSATGGGAEVEKPTLDWVEVPAGEFIFGLSDEGLDRTLAECNSIRGQCEVGWFDQEQPQKTLSLERFQITKYEISNAQYERCVSSGVCEAPNRNLGGDLPMKALYFEDNAPVVAVTQIQASNFCHWIDGSLPSEEQWEKAARGTDGRRYPWGDEFDPAKANISKVYPVNLAVARPSPIESYPNGASPYNAINMAGNVFEWTASERKDSFVVRGGSWNTPFFQGRVTDRGTGLKPDSAGYDIGFRCIRY